jgi:beta-catenin-like protein 1
MPKLPAGSGKRKMPDNPTPEMLMKMRVDAPPAPAPSSPSSQEPPMKRSRAATVEDVSDEQDGDGDTSMDTSFAPGGDADYFAEEDEEGRFFGGGLTSEQKDILNIFDQAGGEGVQDDVRCACSAVILLTMFLAKGADAYFCCFG